MFQPKRIVLKRWQLIPMLVGKLDKNENKLTRRITGWFERKVDTGMRRIKQKSTPRLCPLYSPKTAYYRDEAIGRLFCELVDRTTPLPITAWPASFAPVSIVCPIPRPTAEQLPPLTPRAPPTRDQPEVGVEVQERAAEQSPLPDDVMPPPPPQLSALQSPAPPSGAVEVIGPQIGDERTVLDSLLSGRLRGWREPPFAVCPHMQTHWSRARSALVWRS